MKPAAAGVLQKIRDFLFIYLIFLLSGIVLRLFYTRNEIFFWVNRWHTPFGDRFFSVITYGGTAGAVFTLVFVMLFFSYRKALLVAISSVTASLVGQGLKYVFHFPRPSAYYLHYYDQHKDAPAIYFIPNVHMLLNYSFPSGHSITAFTLGLLFAAFSPRKLNIFWFALALLVSFSRMYLKQHFFEDVLGGSFVGVFFALAMLLWLDARPFIQRPGWNRGFIGR